MPRGMKRESVFADKALQNYLNEISKFKALSREEEHELGLKARAGDPEAMNRLIQANLKPWPWLDIEVGPLYVMRKLGAVQQL